MVVKGRGYVENPPVPYDRYWLELDLDPGLREEWEAFCRTRQIYVDRSREVVHRVSSPDLGIVYALNPYQGCEHGCVYCYARVYHQYWGWSVGLDFEQKIVVKPDAPRLVKRFLLRQREKVPIHMGTATDCYQPVERFFRLTRRLLEVFLTFRYPVRLITKNALICRDVDLLGELARWGLVEVLITVTTLDEGVRRVLEPRTASVRQRLEAIRVLSGRGVPVGVMVAPVVPGLTDWEIPRILEAAYRAGARRAYYTVLRVPPALEGLFTRWAEEHFPGRARRILKLVRACHGGGLSDSRWHVRFRGTGAYARMIERLFTVSWRRLVGGEGLESRAG